MTWNLAQSRVPGILLHSLQTTRSSTPPCYRAPILFSTSKTFTACQDPDYVITLAKAEHEFKRLSSKLRFALEKFRLSGMGDCPWQPEDLDEGDDPRALTDAVIDKHLQNTFSSKFANFCHGDAVLLYAYQLLVEHKDGLLFSAAAVMPPEAQHSSDGTNRNTRPRPGGGKSGRKRDSDLMSALKQPVSFALSPQEKEDLQESIKLNKMKRQRDGDETAGCGPDDPIQGGADDLANVSKRG